MANHRLAPLLCLLSWIGSAHVAAAPKIGGLFNSGSESAERGAILIQELNCVSCHDADSDLKDDSKQAPRLSQVASRINPHYLERFIQQPHAVKPGTTMPNLISRLSDKERDDVAESITHFLLSLQPNAEFQPVGIDSVAADAGRDLFHSVGCVACHSPRGVDGAELLSETSIPLGQLHEKYRLPSLIDFLRRPHKVRPSGRMPELRLRGGEIEKVASYLLRETVVPGHLQYKMYRGKVWQGLDGEVDPERAGLTKDFDLANIKHHHNVAIVFDGFLKIESGGEYEFSFEMNGGTLTIDDQEVVKLDPSNRRKVKTASGRAELNEGWHKIAFTYFHTGRDPKLEFLMKGPGSDAQPPKSEMLSISKEPIAPFAPYSIDKARVAEGRGHFARFGCVACHDDVKVADADRSKNAIPSLSKVDINRGCLADDVATASELTPDFRLDKQQRAEIRAAIPGWKSRKRDDEAVVRQSLVAFNCVACHDRRELGGVAAERNKYFTGSRAELGNEGRLPPPLTDVGAKLTKEWLSEVINNGTRARPYLATVMPVFGPDNVGHLAERLPKIDSLDSVEFEPIADAEEHAKVGHLLVGTDGFGCIGCHDFNGQPAAGPGALDIIASTERLRKDWFYAFMLNPNQFRPGTIMPAAWPNGHVFKKDLLDADVKKQIESIWVYLEAGRRAKNPKGLSRQAAEVRVTDVAEICRGRGPAGYRGIAVGYPESVNLAFDSEEMALRALWKGDFVNVDHGRFSIRGLDRIAFPQGIPFHRLESMDKEWPYKRKTDYTFPQSQGYQFKGYRLDSKRRPTFTYRYGDVQVEEFFAGMQRKSEDGRADVSYFRREFRFATSEKQSVFYFRAAALKALEEVANSDGKAFRGGGLTIRIVAGDVLARPATVRRGEPDELLVPLALPAGKSGLVLEYEW